MQPGMIDLGRREADIVRGRGRRGDAGVVCGGSPRPSRRLAGKGASAAARVAELATRSRPAE